MKKNSTLPNIRISTELNEKINKCLISLNKNEAEFEITLPQFRRMAYKNFAERVLSEGLDLSFKLKRDTR